MHKWLVLVLMGLAFWLAPGGVGAQPPASPPATESAKEQAKKLFESGIASYKKKKFKQAIDYFREADKLYPNPVLSFNAARAYEDLGDDAGALRFYRSYLRLSANAQDRGQVEKRIGELEQALRAKGLQQVTVMSTPDAATVVIDGRPVGVTPWTGEIHPGKHKLKLQREGYAAAEKEFELLPHRAMDVALTLEAAPNEPGAPVPVPTEAAPAAEPPAPELPSQPPPDAPKKRGVQPLTLIVLGVGGATLAGAGVFELLRRQSESAARDEPTQVGRADKIDQMESRQKTARILAGVGGAVTVVGGVLLVLDLTSNKSSSEAGAPTARFGGGCGPNGCSMVYGGRF